MRTQLAITDADWLPGSAGGTRWAVTGSAVGAAAGIGLGFAVTPLMAITFPYLALAGAGVSWGIGRLTRRARLRLLASGAGPRARLPERVGGRLAYVRGIVRAQAQLPALLDGRPVVYRRLMFYVDGALWIHEAAVDFTLDVAAREAVNVEVAGARWLSPPLTPTPQSPETGARLLALLPQSGEWVVSARRELLALGHIEATAAEATIEVGEELEVIGYKEQRVDPTVASRLERDIPMRTTIRAGALPVVLSRVKPPG